MVSPGAAARASSSTPSYAPTPHNTAFIAPGWLAALRAVFDALDMHGRGEAEVKDLLLALRQDRRVGEFLHLPMRVRQEDAARTTLQHIFDVVDENHDGRITWAEFEHYFSTHAWNAGTESFVEAKQGLGAVSAGTAGTVRTAGVNIAGCNSSPLVAGAQNIDTGSPLVGTLADIDTTQAGSMIPAPLLVPSPPPDMTKRTAADRSSSERLTVHALRTATPASPDSAAHWAASHTVDLQHHFDDEIIFQRLNTALSASAIAVSSIGGRLQSTKEPGTPGNMSATGSSTASPPPYSLVAAARVGSPPRTLLALLGDVPERAQQRDPLGMLPLHHVIRRKRPSVDVVKGLLEAFPGAAGEKDVDGLLPLHHAVRRNFPSVDLVSALLEAFPAAARTPDKLGLLPLSCAAENPTVALDVLAMLLQANPAAQMLARKKQTQVQASTSGEMVISSSSKVQQRRAALPTHIGDSEDDNHHHHAVERSITL